MMPEVTLTCFLCGADLEGEVTLIGTATILVVVETCKDCQEAAVKSSYLRDNLYRKGFQAGRQHGFAQGTFEASLPETSLPVTLD